MIQKWCEDSGKMNDIPRVYSKVKTRVYLWTRRRSMKTDFRWTDTPAMKMVDCALRRVRRDDKGTIGVHG